MRPQEVRAATGSGSKFAPGDTLFARITPCLENGKIAQYAGDTPGMGSTEFFVLRARSDVSDPSFIYYFAQCRELRSAAEKSMSGASGRQRADIGSLREYACEFPSLPIQRHIASILSAYDDLIENSQRRIRILEEMARALYREWFVHFRFPGHEGQRRVRSAVGEIPERWEVKRIGDVAATLRGRSYRTPDLADEGGLPFLNLKCIERDGGFRRSGLKRYVGDFKASHVAKKGDIIVAVTDMTQERRIVAHAGLVPSLGGEVGVCSMDLVRVQPNAAISTSFLYSLLRFSSFAEEVKQHANGANVLHLSPERITDFRFAMPPNPIMERYTCIAAPCFDQIDTLENEGENLRRTRDLLLPRLLSGQLNVEAV